MTKSWCNPKGKDFYSVSNTTIKGGDTLSEEAQILIEANKNSEFLSKNFKKFQDKYSNRIIAIKNKQVIKAAKNVESLVKDLPGQELSSVLVASIPPKGTAFIL